jgi:hypothetical protein
MIALGSCRARRNPERHLPLEDASILRGGIGAITGPYANTGEVLSFILAVTYLSTAGRSNKRIEYGKQEYSELNRYDRTFRIQVDGETYTDRPGGTVLGDLESD